MKPIELSNLESRQLTASPSTLEKNEMQIAVQGRYRQIQTPDLNQLTW